MSRLILDRAKNLDKYIYLHVVRNWRKFYHLNLFLFVKRITFFSL